MRARGLIAVEWPTNEGRVREIVREELKVMLGRGVRVGESRVSVGEIVDEMSRREAAYQGPLPRPPEDRKPPRPPVK